MRIGKGAMSRSSRSSNASSSSTSAASTTSSAGQGTTTHHVTQHQVLRSSTQVSRRGSMSTSESHFPMNESDEYGWGHFVDITPIWEMSALLFCYFGKISLPACSWYHSSVMLVLHKTATLQIYVFPCWRTNKLSLDAFHTSSLSYCPYHLMTIYIVLCLYIMFTVRIAWFRRCGRWSRLWTSSMKASKAFCLVPCPIHPTLVDSCPFCRQWRRFFRKRYY